MPFQFQPTPRDTGTIIDLIRAGADARSRALLQGADAQARAAELSGQAWAGGVQQAGQAVSGTLLDLAKQRQQAPMLAQEAQIRDQRLEAGGLELQDAHDQRTAKTAATAAQAAAQQTIAQIKSGNGQQLVDQLRQTNPQAADMAQAYLDKRMERTNADRKERAVLARDMGYDPMVVETMLGLEDDPQSARQHFQELTQGDPAKVKAYVDHFAGVAAPAPKFSTVAAGGSVVDDNTGKITATAPKDAPVPTNPTEASLAAIAARGGPEGAQAQRALDLLTKQKTAGTAPKDERLVQIMRNGVPTWVKESEAVGQPAAQAARAVTGAERQALAFYNRAQEAVNTLTNADGGTSLEDRVSKAGVMTQGRLQYAPNWLQTEDGQAYRQAQRAFTEARLRKESGAAINNAEYEKDSRTYFAQPGDSKKLIDQKRKARQTVLDGLKFGAGKAFDEFYGEDRPMSGVTITSIKEIQP